MELLFLFTVISLGFLLLGLLPLLVENLNLDLFFSLQLLVWD